MSITTRKARLSDAETLSDLSMRSKQSNGYDDAFMEACRDELTVREEDFQTTEYWVAVEDGICGMVGLTPDADGKAAEVCGLFIDPDHQRKGIGQMLWDIVVKDASKRGLTSLYLDADPAAVPFYEALGLKTIRQEPSGSIPGRFLPHMELRLT
jgi:N-acetylglutamate synthase-like GNAT family acetyltransferase